MTANYYFQHFVLKEDMEKLDHDTLKSIILNNDEKKAKDIFIDALCRANLSMFKDMYKFKCEFITNKELPVLVYYFDDVVNGFQAVSECYAAIVVVGNKIEYYGVEYSFGDSLVLGQMKGNTHCNYGFYSMSDMQKIIERVIKMELDKDIKKTNNVNNEPKKNSVEQQATISPQTSNNSGAGIKSNNKTVGKKQMDTPIDVKKQFGQQIVYIKKIQKSIIAVFVLLLLFTFIFSISVPVTKNNSLPKETDALSTKLTSLDSTAKTYCNYKDNHYYIYQKVDGSIKVYEFSNLSAYSSGSSVARKGCATSSDIKKYFGNNVVSGKPSTAFVLPAVIPVGIVFYLLFTGIIVSLIIVLHKRAKELIFKLNKLDKQFVDNLNKYKNGDIIKSEYNRTEKLLFSQNIMDDSKAKSLFRLFY